MRLFYRSPEALRSVLLVLVMGAALAAVALKDPRSSSFFAGFAAGAGLLFVFSSLRRRFGEPRDHPAGREWKSHDEDPDR
jgi:hypothetical protein